MKHLVQALNSAFGYSLAHDFPVTKFVNSRKLFQLLRRGIVLNTRPVGFTKLGGEIHRVSLERKQIRPTLPYQMVSF